MVTVSATVSEVLMISAELKLPTWQNLCRHLLCAHLGKYDEAIKYLNNFDGTDQNGGSCRSCCIVVLHTIGSA